MHAIILAVRDGNITTTSRQIAEHFGKRHTDVLRAIANLECSPEFSQRNFASADYLDEQGKPRKEYTITRDGFVFLAMGFTGKDAAQWKEAYIGAFNAMEAELRAPKVGAGGTAVKALPVPKDKLSKELRQHINRTAHQIALKQYDTIHRLLTECAADNLACGAKEADCFGYVEAFADTADGVCIANVRDLKELVWNAEQVINTAAQAVANIRRIENRSGYRLAMRIKRHEWENPDFHKHDRLVQEVLERMTGEDE